MTIRLVPNAEGNPEDAPEEEFVPVPSKRVKKLKREKVKVEQMMVTVPVQKRESVVLEKLHVEIKEKKRQSHAVILAEDPSILESSEDEAAEPVVEVPRDPPPAGLATSARV